MGAVDKVDMMNSFVECTWKKTKWHKKIFFHLIDTAALNGHIVHLQLTGDMITDKVFFVIGVQFTHKSHTVALCNYSDNISPTYPLPRHPIPSLILPTPS
jgi:hypothetical protein